MKNNEDENFKSQKQKELQINATSYLGNVIRVVAEENVTYAAVLKDLAKHERTETILNTSAKTEVGEYIFSQKENASLPELQKQFQKTLMIKKMTMVTNSIPDITTEEAEEDIHIEL